MKVRKFIVNVFKNRSTNNNNRENALHSSRIIDIIDIDKCTDRHSWSSFNKSNNNDGNGIVKITTTSNGGNTHINQIPIELLQYIISFCIKREMVDQPVDDPNFPNVSMTCQLWNQIARQLIESFKMDRQCKLPSPSKLQSLKKFKSIRSINVLGGDTLSPLHINILSDIIVNNGTLTRLNLFSNKIGDLGLSRLTMALECNRTILFLGLSYCEITSRSGYYLGRLLDTNQSLKEIVLSYNELGRDGCIELSKGLRHNRSLTTLSLCNNDIGDDGAMEMGNLLAVNHTITELNLRCNSISSEGSKYISTSLHINKTIVGIDLWGNSIGWSGATGLGTALQHNQSLKSINLTRNAIQQGIKSITTALSNPHCSITTIDLSMNLFGSVGAKDVASIITLNISVVNITLSSNQFGDQGIKYIAEALKSNNKIESLNLAMNEIGYDGVSHLADSLKQNDRLIHIDLSMNKITNDGVLILLENNNNSKIQKLTLSHNPIDIEDSKIKSIISNQNQSNLNTNNNLYLDICLPLIQLTSKMNPSMKFVTKVAGNSSSRLVARAGHNLKSITLNTTASVSVNVSNKFNNNINGFKTSSTLPSLNSYTCDSLTITRGGSRITNSFLLEAIKCSIDAGEDDDGR